MPRLFYTYLVNQILVPFYASLVILTSILFLVKLIPILDIILDYNISLNDFIRLYAYYTPQLLLFTLPMSSMMGTILGAVHLANEREIMIIKSSGISFYQMLPPVIIIAICTSLLTGLFAIHLIPMGNSARAELLFRLAKERIEHSLKEKQFSESLGDVVLYADQINQEKKTLRGVYISDMRDNQNPLLILAQSGKLASDIKRGLFTLKLQEGSLHRDRDDASLSIRFDEYSLNLPVSEPEKNPLAKTGRSTMTQLQLLNRAETLGRDTKIGAQYLIEYHKRMVLPVGCFILTLLGFPLGLITGPHRKPIGIPFGLMVFISYYILLTAGDAIAKTHLAPTALAMWIPNLFFIVVALFFLQSTARESLSVHLEKIFELLYRVSSKFNWFNKKDA